jgi:hypothetical protein
MKQTGFNRNWWTLVHLNAAWLFVFRNLASSGKLALWQERKVKWNAQAGRVDG